MSDYITAYGHLSVVASGMTAFAGVNITYGLTGTVLAQTQAVGTTAELLDLGDVGGGGAPGLIYIRNIDSTNYFEVALDSGMTKRFARIYAGGVIVFTPAASSYYVKAPVAPVNIELIASGQVSTSSGTAGVHDTTPLYGARATYMSAAVTGSAGGVSVNGAGTYTETVNYPVSHTIEIKGAAPEQRAIAICNLMAVNTGVEDINIGMGSGSDAFAILKPHGGFCLIPYHYSTAPYFWCETGDQTLEILYVQ